MRSWLLAPRLLACLALAVPSACATRGQITNIDQPGCRGAFSQAVGSILLAQGETKEAADRLAVQTLDELGPGDHRDFVIESASGTEYSFFVHLEGSDCLLRLYQRQRPNSSYLNNLTYIETRPLPSCTCAR